MSESRKKPEALSEKILTCHSVSEWAPEENNFFLLQVQSLYVALKWIKDEGKKQDI